ncbi:hypothetical protein ASF49_21015 [Methylobacterium sp. Leaf104]|jgi:hypothetical protein|uniref:hypothetical protein n=1 Tax=Methylobacterium TaxID=407 RepID=UPI0006F6E887|nr:MULTISPECIES: hypothetical protein [Methylobacterium]KQO69193.1 hypothetical protein ASF18_01760 [Methylobacterium sp. Leaf89]KQP40280.1 hypothetical protein ASF49_21015 [Methylobacterium sp. Leaf104]MCI9882644.1 hypothetical protein [Methylobacterium goesingense]
MAVVRRVDAGPGTPVRLEGVCPVEDAETLASLILEDPSAPVDWTACTRMHTAVYQVLLRLRPTILGTSGDPFVGRWLTPPSPG